MTCLVLAGALLALSPVAAAAHLDLESSAPAKDARLAATPSELRLTFTAATERSLSRVELVGPDGLSVTLAPIRYVDGDERRTFLAPISGRLRDGTYTVIWQVAGADGHPVRGRFTFTILPGATGLAATADSASTPADDSETGVPTSGQTPIPDEHHNPATMPAGPGFNAESPLYVVVRWLTFTGLLIVIGAAVFHLLVLGFLRRAPEPHSPMVALASARAATVGLWAAAVVGVAALLRLYAQSYALYGPNDALNGSFLGTMLGRTLWGWGWLLQAAAVVVTVVGFIAARRRTESGNTVGAWGLAALGATLLAFTPALSGHAASVPRFTALAILADGVHVIGAAGWLGSLLLMVVVGIPLALRLPEGDRGSAVADIVNAYSPTALVFAGIVATTGVFSAWLHLESVGALWQTSYGQTLLVKLAVLSVVAGTGAYNWLRIKPTLGDVASAVRVRRSASTELAVGLVVLLITAVLVATPPQINERMSADAPQAGQTGAVAGR